MFYTYTDNKSSVNICSLCGARLALTVPDQIEKYSKFTTELCYWCSGRQHDIEGNNGHKGDSS